MQQETRKQDGQCVDFCDILKDRFFFLQTDCMPKLSDGMFRRTTCTEGQQLGLFVLTVFGKYFTVVTLSVHLSFMLELMLRTNRDRILNRNPKTSDTRKSCCNHLIN